MKLTFAVLLFLVASDFAFAKDSKSSSKDERTVFFCVDTEIKSIRTNEAETLSIKDSCKDFKKFDKEDCYKKATSALCKAKANPTPLFGDVTEFPNKLSCADFANRFLEKRGLGNLTKPSASVNTIEKVSYAKSGLPKFQFGISTGTPSAVKASSEFNKESQMETWTLEVTSSKNVPSFEPAFKMNDEVKEEVTDRTHDGTYRRLYRFNVINNVCVLDKVDIEFSPKAPKGEEGSVKYRKSERTLTQRECDYSAPAIHGENFHKSFRVRQAVDILDPWICNESMASFNQPEKVVAGASAKRNARGTQAAGQGK